MGFKFLLPFFAIIAVLTLRINAKRNYDIILENIKCDANPKYIETPICYVTKNSTKSLGYTEIKLKRDINSLRFSLDFIYTRNKNEKYQLLNSKNNDFCAFLKGSMSLNLMNIVRDILLTFGNLPKSCPMPKGFHFMFKDYFIDAERFPAYVPEGNFTVTFNSTCGEEFVLSTQTTGYTVQMSRVIRWG